MNMFGSLLNRLRMRGEPPEVAPEAPNAPDPVPEDVRQALMRLQGEWAAMQLHWAEVLDKLQAWSNRQSARDRKAAGKALDRLGADEEVPQHQPDIPAHQPTLAETKADLRRRAAALSRGIA